MLKRHFNNKCADYKSCFVVQVFSYPLMHNLVPVGNSCLRSDTDRLTLTHFTEEDIK